MFSHTGSLAPSWQRPENGHFILVPGRGEGRATASQARATTVGLTGAESVGLGVEVLGEETGVAVRGSGAEGAGRADVTEYAHDVAVLGPEAAVTGETAPPATDGGTDIGVQGKMEVRVWDFTSHQTCFL